MTSSRSLDDLGAQLAKDGDAARTYLAGSAGGTTDGGGQDGSKDVGCPGGTRRTYRASVTAPTSAAGGAATATDVRNTQGLAAQVAFKRIGYDLADAVDKSQDSLPATLHFANDPASKDQQRSFSTTVSVEGGSVTMTITGRTACVRD